jgi:hypothetical protein
MLQCADRARTCMRPCGTSTTQRRCPRPSPSSARNTGQSARRYRTLRRRTTRAAASSRETPSRQSTTPPARRAVAAAPAAWRPTAASAGAPSCGDLLNGCLTEALWASLRDNFPFGCLFGPVLLTGLYCVVAHVVSPRSTHACRTQSPLVARLAGNTHCSEKKYLFGAVRLSQHPVVLRLSTATWFGSTRP